MRYGAGKAEMPRLSDKERKGGWEGEIGRESGSGTATSLMLTLRRGKMAGVEVALAGRS